MTEKRLKELKIPEMYVLSPGKLLTSICSVRSEDGEIISSDEINKLNHRQVKYLVSELGRKPKNSDITRDNILRGKVLLVRYHINDIKVYKRPGFLAKATINESDKMVLNNDLLIGNRQPSNQKVLSFKNPLTNVR